MDQQLIFNIYLLTLKGKAIKFDKLDEGLKKADIVISSTTAPHYLIKRSMVKKIMDKRDKPLLFIDLALPRDVEPTVGDLERVTLYNMEDLDLVIEENMVKRTKEAEKAEEIVREEVQEFTRKMEKRGCQVPVLLQLERCNYNSP